MIKKIREIINIGIAKSPRKAVLIGIMLFNATFMMIAAAIITALSKRIDGLAECGYWEALYRTVTMILDAGCIDNVITDVGKAGAFAAIVCIVVVVLGMVFFTGAVIGYITNLISDYIDSKNNGKNRLLISDHVVIINWNARGAEIINELLYTQQKMKVVVFVPDNRDEINEEIRNRLDTTLLNETQLKDCITFIVREGDVAAARDLDDICISKARTVVILESEKASRERGNTQTVKTLIQVSEISKSNNNQRILVEISDDWTEDLVSKIMAFNKDGKETIVPILYKYLLGQTSARIAINPEISDDYDKLISEKFEKEKRNVILLGHNSYIDAMISYLGTYQEDLSIFIVDSEEDLARHNNYKDYPFVKTLKAGVYDEEEIDTIVLESYNNSMDKTSILILSDDAVEYEDTDANTLTYLVYIQELIRQAAVEDPEFNRNDIDVIVEVLNPKNAEIVRTYGADKIIISNKYVSRWISESCI